MNPDGDRSTDEYIVTALQIFHYCGANSTSTLRVDELMDKFAPFVKTNKAEYSYLRSLLDPDQSNPEITVSMLASTLNKYSENQKVKVDLEESFNLKSGQVPQDSDSGISTDGFILLEELQCELREKSHLAQQLRTQLDYSDRHHEEALAAITAERDTLRAHLNMLREESSMLTHVRRDYEEACERLCGSERALDDARRELDGAKRRAKVLTEQVAVLETEKLTLQELLAKSKEECHRINDMYASRQSTLLEENETLRTEHADLSARLQDQEEFMQQVIKEKVLLEMELKDMLNKSNQNHLHMDRSIDVSFTEDQMLTALDSLNSDSRFQQEGRILDEESFAKVLRGDQGRSTNISLFDEIRLSFCNMSRSNLPDLNNSQTFEKTSDALDNSLITVSTQTENEFYTTENKDDICKTCNRRIDEDDMFAKLTENNDLYMPFNKNNFYLNEDCIVKRNVSLTTTTSETTGLTQNGHCSSINRTEFQKIKTQNKATNTSRHILEVFKDIEVMNFGTQTDVMENPNNNNNNSESCIECTKCVECEKLNKYTRKLEQEIKQSHKTAEEIYFDLAKYDENLGLLKRLVDEGNERNNLLKTVIDSLKTKLDMLEKACASQGEKIEFFCNTCSAGIQTECEQTSVSTQVEIPCTNCVKNNTSHRRLRRYLWEPLKCLFQLFAVICFVCALSALCGVTRRRRACREPLPWRWLQPHDLIDLLLSVEYVADVPM